MNPRLMPGLGVSNRTGSRVTAASESEFFHLALPSLAYNKLATALPELRRMGDVEGRLARL